MHFYYYFVLLLLLRQDPSYMGYDVWAEQKICNGDWSYEIKHFQGCPVAVTYPVARNCKCAACNVGNTHCGRFFGDVSSCRQF